MTDKQNPDLLLRDNYMKGRIIEECLYGRFIFSANLNSTHEVFSDCANCQQTCRHMFYNETVCASEKKCEPGYACDDGYLREPAIGQCVPKGECFRAFPRWIGK